MCVGRQIIWRVAYDYISTDSPVGAVRMKTDALFQQLAAVLESRYFVIESFVRELLL